MTHRVDFLVIGTGIAGLSYALKASRYGSVALVTKKERAESNTNYAQGGVAAVMSTVDSFDLHVRDTLNTGVGLCHRDAVETMVREGPARIRELIDIGARFTNREGQLDLGREGGHSTNRIVHARDFTGKEIERALLQAVSESPAIKVYEDHVAIELITEHHLNPRRPPGKDGIHCWGAYVLDSIGKRVDTFLAHVVLLATGGLGQIYLHTTNPVIATGDGVAMACRAGAKIANMEFIQFHPTTLFNSGSPSFLISEAVRGFGAILRARNGDEFMHLYDQRKELAPRDIVAYAIDTELKKRGNEYVLLDLRHLPPDQVREHFPHIYETCLGRFKLDITQEPIPVVPAAHYSCGGVVTDLDGRTSIHGLYAAGEVSMTGVHGANRLASNSLLEALVFSDRALRSSAAYFGEQKLPVPDVNPWDDSGTINSEEWILVAHNQREIQEIMWDYVGIVRSDLRLGRAQRRMELLRAEVEDFYKRTRVNEGLLELRNLALCATLVIRCATLRKESRGLHVTTNYKDRDDAGFLRDTTLE
jgi:L-aspartate oxidase